MTIDLRTSAERRYDALKDGSAYVKPAALQDDPRVDLPLLPEEATILDHLWAGLALELPAGVQFGQLADGTPIMGDFEPLGAAGQRSGVVSIDTPGWSLHADADGMIAGGNKRDTITLEELTYQDVIELRALVASDTFERLYAAAVAWERGDTAAPGAGNNQIAILRAIDGGE